MSAAGDRRGGSPPCPAGPGPPRRGTRRTPSRRLRRPPRPAARTRGSNRSGAPPASPDLALLEGDTRRVRDQVPHRRTVGPGRVVPVERALLDRDQHGVGHDRLGDRGEPERPLLLAGHRRDLAVGPDDRGRHVRDGPVEHGSYGPAQRVGHPTHRGRRWDLVAMARAWIGTSGWRYPPWRGVFYPQGLPQRRELAHLAGLVNSVEINGSFYSLQRPDPTARGRRRPRRLPLRRQGQPLHHPPQAAARRPRAARELPRLGRARARAQARPGAVATAAATCPSTRRGSTSSSTLLPRSTGAAAQLAGEHDERLDGRAETVDGRGPPPAARAGGPPRELPRPGLRHAAPRARRRAGRGRHRRDVPVPRRRHRRLRLRPAARRHRALHQRLLAAALDRWAGKVRAWLAGESPVGEHTVAPPAPRTPRDVFVYFDNDAKVHAPFDAIGLAQRVD